MVNFMINYVAVIVVAVINMAIGMLWWSSMMFGPLWAKAMKFPKGYLNKQKGEMPRNALIDFAGKIVMGVVLSYVVQIARVTALAQGALLGLLLWIGVVIPLTLGNMLWDGKSFTSWSVGAAYNLVIMVIATAILAAW